MKTKEVLIELEKLDKEKAHFLVLMFRLKMCILAIPYFVSAILVYVGINVYIFVDKMFGGALIITGVIWMIITIIFVIIDRYRFKDTINKNIMEVKNDRRRNKK